VKWRADFHKRYGTPVPGLGFVCSPWVVNNSAYVQTADSLINVAKTTGKSLWRCLDGQDKGLIRFLTLPSYNTDYNCLLRILMLSAESAWKPATSYGAMNSPSLPARPGCVVSASTPVQKGVCPMNTRSHLPQRSPSEQGEPAVLVLLGTAFRLSVTIASSVLGSLKTLRFSENPF